MLRASKSCWSFVLNNESSTFILVLIKVRLLIFLVLSRDGLVSLYRIISQISIYIYIFWYFWYRIFIFKIKLQLIGYLNSLRQVRWFFTWSVEKSIFSSDSQKCQKIQIRQKNRGKPWSDNRFLNFHLF